MRSRPARARRGERAGLLPGPCFALVAADDLAPSKQSGKLGTGPPSAARRAAVSCCSWLVAGVRGSRPGAAVQCSTSRPHAAPQASARRKLLRRPALGGWRLHGPTGEESPSVGGGSFSLGELGPPCWYYSMVWPGRLFLRTEPAAGYQVESRMAIKWILKDHRNTRSI